MNFNIYGGRLEPGHCEVHPDMHQEYPCDLCMSERRASERTPLDKAQDKIDRLMACLHYYANPKYWVLRTGTDDNAMACVMPDSWFSDRGEKARETLAQLGEQVA